MISTPDIECEMDDPKIQSVTDSIYMMYSGDAAVFGEVFQDLLTVVRTKDDKGAVLTVPEVARIWSRQYTEARYRRAESTVFAPYGLDRRTFVERLTTLDPKLIEKIISELTKVKIRGVEVLIAGTDRRHGDHLPCIWQRIDEEVFCADQLAFAAIGTGARHAESELLTSGFTWLLSLPDAMLSTYLAKKKAEVAPGVGEKTDIVIIGRKKEAEWVNEYVHNELQNQYKRKAKVEAAALARARRAATAVLKEWDEAVATAETEKENDAARKSADAPIGKKQTLLQAPATE